MEYFVCLLLLAIGIILVVKGGDWFVDAASWMAEVSGIPTFIIGATIVSLATTLPEILVSSISAGQGNAGLAIGNAVGSVNANIALIMAISLIFMPVAFKRKDYATKMILLVVAIGLLWGMCALGEGLTWWQALIVLAIFVVFMVENIISAKKHDGLEVDNSLEEIKERNKQNGISLLLLEDFTSSIKKEVVIEGGITIKKTGITISKKELVLKILLFLVGAGAIIGGAELMCIYGEKFAKLCGVPDEIIGVTILAVGTSLPELVTTITAIAKKKSELSVGNVIGANIIDITLILAICAFVNTGKYGAALPLNPQCMMLDFPFCLAAAFIACIPSLIMGRFRRWQGILLLMGYIAYITILVLSTPQVALISF